MIKFDSTEQLCFHDCNLVKILNSSNEINLHIENIYADDDKYSTKILLRNVDQIKKNGVIVDKIRMETDDGELYSFYEENLDIVIDVIWHKYSPNSEEFCTYLLEGKSMMVEVYDTTRSE
jgi:hypothetical protein